MSQAAIKFALAKSSIISVLPNFTTLEELHEYTSASEAPDLTTEEQTQLDDLWNNAFDLKEPAAQFREI